MGILSWWKGGNKDASVSKITTEKGGNKDTSVSKITTEKEKANSKAAIVSTEEVPGMNGALEVSRPGPNVDVTVFEFGSIAASSDDVTLAGYCPVSDDLEPCRWEILPATGSDAPQFRVVF